jgi:hypothetical protein
MIRRPADRDDACRETCYLLGTPGCTGRCRLQAQEEQRRREMAQYMSRPVDPEEQERRAARAAEWRAAEARMRAASTAALLARDEAERIVRTPAKTLRRRARLAARNPNGGTT